MNYQKKGLVVVLIFLVISLVGNIIIYEALPGRKDQVLEPTDNDENKTRIAFFSDPHITNNQEEIQTDFGAPSYKISRDAKIALNSLNADYIFGLGDLTAHSQHEEWVGYENWISDLNAPVYDYFGNHDRDHREGLGSYGTGYYTEVGRATDTRVLKMGNNVFILVSEEHDPERDGDKLASTIPKKRFDFVEKYLGKYSENNNIFLMNHVQLSGTVARSEVFFLGSNPNWIHISDEYKEIMGEHGTTAHFSGHIHTDYRWRDNPWDLDLNYGVENVGKFISGEKINKADRKYRPDNLPPNYFLNMPAVDYAHGWLNSRMPLVYRAYKEINPSFSGENSEQELTSSENRGPPITDIFRTPKTSKFIGRGGVYYAELEEGEESAVVVTRWIGGNRDVENYEMELDYPVKLGDGEMNLVASDLSLRKKGDNIVITRDNWFKVQKGSRGHVEMSKKYSENVEIFGMNIENHQEIESYEVEWKGSNEKEQPWKWSDTWEEDPEDLGEVNAVKIKLRIKANNESNTYIEDINLETS